MIIITDPPLETAPSVASNLPTYLPLDWVPTPPPSATINAWDPYVLDRILMYYEYVIR